MSASEAQWFATTVRPRHEASVERSLSVQGLEPYLPMYESLRQWCDRKKTVRIPLFPGYVFCRFQRINRAVVLKTPGVISVVATAGVAIPIPDAELERVKALVSSGLPVGPWPFLNCGDRVQVRRGPLKGMEGILVEVKNGWRLVVDIAMLQRSVSVTLDRDVILRADN